MTQQEKQRIANFCNQNPAKAIETLQIIATELGYTSPRNYAKNTGIAERTVYHNIKDTDAAKLAVDTIDGQKFIIAKLS